MAYHKQETEHSGPKQGQEAFQGRKSDLKENRKKIRRRQVQEVTMEEAFEDLKKELEEWGKSK